MSPEEMLNANILKQIEVATEEMSAAETEIIADSREIREIKRNHRSISTLREPSFFVVLSKAIKGLFDL